MLFLEPRTKQTCFRLESRIGNYRYSSPDPPEGATHTPLLVSEKLLGHPFRALGFPRQFESGVWASGVLLEEVEGNYIQVESFIGGQIQFGFSGAPVWDDKLGGIVGIINL